MYPETLNDNIILNEENIYKAHWKLHKNGGILLVCNKNQKFEGVITLSDIARTYNNDQLTVKDICNTNCKYIVEGGGVLTIAIWLQNIFLWIIQELTRFRY